MIKEIDALGSDFQASIDHLETRLPFLDAVLKETLRLFPTLHFVAREALKEQFVKGMTT